MGSSATTVILQEQRLKPGKRNWFTAERLSASTR